MSHLDRFVCVCVCVCVCEWNISKIHVISMYQCEEVERAGAAAAAPPPHLCIKCDCVTRHVYMCAVLLEYATCSVFRNSLLNTVVKKLQKSVNICHSYQKKCVFVYYRVHDGSTG